MSYTRPTSPTDMARRGRLNLAVFQLNTQVWLCALRSVGGIYGWEDCSCHVPAGAAAAALLAISAKAQFTLTALPLHPNELASRKWIMLQPCIMYPGIWADAGLTSSCVHIYSLCNKVRATISRIGPMWLIAQMLNFFVSQLSFVPVIHLLVSVSTGWGIRGDLGGQE